MKLNRHNELDNRTYLGAGCPLNRREFLARFGIAGGAILTLNSGFVSFDSQVDISRPTLPGEGEVKPRIRVAFSRRLDDYSDWMSSPGAAYDPAASQSMYTKILENAASTLNVDLDIENSPLRGTDCVDLFIRETKARGANSVIIIVMQSHADGWGQIDHFIEHRNDLPALVYAPRGTYFRTSQLRQYQGISNFFLGATHDVDWLATGMRNLKVLWQMENTHLADIGGNPEGGEKLEPIGITVNRISLERYVDAYRATEGSTKARDIANEYFEKVKEIVEPSKDDLIESARTYLACRQIMDDTGCHALTLDCLSLVRDPGTPTCPPPCLAFSRLLDERTCGCCERDINAAILLMLSSYLFDKPGFMHNPTPFTVRKTYGGTHCSAPTLMSGFTWPGDSLVLRSHAESDVGVAPQVKFGTNQPATLMQFVPPNRLLVATGTILANIVTKPGSGVGGCRTGVEMAMDDVDNVLDIPDNRHNVLIYGRHLHELNVWGQLAGVNVEHFTKSTL